ncbi:MAG: PIN domain-containing protein [Pseudomonadota bacterium]|jgi:hypothetical protein
MAYPIPHSVLGADLSGIIASMSDGQRKGPEPVVPLKGEDVFWLTDLYPDAKALFEHDHANLTDVVDACIVVLDANVLLLPFEFSKASVGEVERVYKELATAGRLVVPGQAAREFYKHRSKKIAAIVEAIDCAIGRARKQIFDKPIPLLEDDPDYQAARELGKEVIKKGNEVVEKLSAINVKLQDELGADRVSILYRNILGGCVTEVAIGVDERKAVIDEVARRARLQIAPGYKDHNKEDGGVGDYLVWRAILQEGESRKTHCIFVTEEQKSDWWVKKHGTFQPRPELIEEYRRASEGKSIHFLPLSALLSNFKAGIDTVNEVQQLEEEKRENDAAIAPSVRDKFTHYRNLKTEKRNREIHENLAQIDLIDGRIKRLKEMVSKDGLIDDDIAQHIYNLSLDRSGYIDEIESLVAQSPNERLSFDFNSMKLREWLGHVVKEG